MDFDFFRKFKPKSLKEILEESKEKWQAEAKSLAESGPIFPWIYTVNVEDLDSAEFTLDPRRNKGSQVTSYRVYLDERECDITERSGSHDTVYLHDGGGKLELGGGNDTIENTYIDLQGERFESSGGYEIYGEGGNDRLVGNRGFSNHSGCLLDGGDDNDVLVSTNKSDRLIGGKDSDHLIARWNSDASMTGGHASGQWGDGDNFFEIEVLTGRRSGTKTITDFDSNDKIRFANRTDEWLNIVSPERNVYKIYTDETMTHVATIHTHEDLWSIAQDGGPGSDLIFTGASYGAQFEDSNNFPSDF